MRTISLNGQWELRSPLGSCFGTVPGSVYSILMENGLLEDPFYRDNEGDALKMMENDFQFVKDFAADAGSLRKYRVLLRCEGLDTIFRIVLNGVTVGSGENMHRTYEFDITGCLQDNNHLEICFSSPLRYIRQAYQQHPIYGMEESTQGYPYLRKAHCMFGWDWGPRLPDAGIWRDMALVVEDSSRLTDTAVRQIHEPGRVCLQPVLVQSGQAQERITVTSPSQQIWECRSGETLVIDNPSLWWPNGLGGQPLYTVCFQLLEQGCVVDEKVLRIGLRTLTIAREKDSFGESFCHMVNGVRFFGMGADYIPMDNLLSRITYERVKVLLTQCADCHFNVIRVWGGGYYPEDYFYDLCDELGLVVWQDFMFACADYRLTPCLEENIREEIRDNVCRLRHHASLGLWCGNNENEMFLTRRLPSMPQEERRAVSEDYLKIHEVIMPELLRKYDPDTFYWPSSPSSAGGFDDPNSPDRGDTHYWDVWHRGEPFTAYRRYFFRYASEFGFQSFPCLKTVESFTLPQDRNIFSDIMSLHQRNASANGRILSYLEQTFLYPTAFDTVLYASQLLSAYAVQYGVEHFRRNRGRCMGAVYWQLNDIWPSASWSSIDYYGRYKALQYFAKRFFAPVLLSCEEKGEFEGGKTIISQQLQQAISARLSVANETRKEVSGFVRYRLCDAGSHVLRAGECSVRVPSLSSLWLEAMDFTGIDVREVHLWSELEADGGTFSCGSTLFTVPKYYRFRDPQLTVTVAGSTIVVHACAYARSVEISCDDSDLILSDNYFDMEAGSRAVQILKGKPGRLKLRSVYDIR